MSYIHFYKKLDTLARKTFPGLQELPEIAWDYMISPLEIKLPKSVLENATNAIRAFYALSRRPSFEALLEPQVGISSVPKKQNSVLMAYDFHTNEAGDCHLVEINTNAAGFMFSSLMTMVHEDRTDSPALEQLRLAFLEEVRLAGIGAPAPSVAITDEDVRQQKMYSEFLMYRDWFRQMGWPAEFCDDKDFTFNGGLKDPSGRKIDLVYNRTTDFYLEESHSASLLEAYRTGAACVTPNPREYWLLSDKQRLIQFTEPGFLERAGASDQEAAAIRKVLIPTFEKTALGDADEIWSQRKNLFFKPKHSFGGKSVYRGESVSRKVFERLMMEDTLIQQFTPAQKVPVDDPRSVLSNWKFDLRFYVYADRIQLAAARIYQGQVTNFSSPLGGFTLVRF